MAKKKKDEEQKVEEQVTEVENKEAEEQTTPEEEQVVTIAPTMVDEDELDKQDKKTDLTSITPEFQTTKTSDQISLESKENELKSDGSIVIGNVVDDTYNYVEGAKLPEMIDVAARKKFLKKNKDAKMNISEADVQMAERQKKKILNITSIVSLCIIAFLVAFYFYWKATPTEKDFKPLNVTVELGDALPSSKSAYVKPGIGTEVDEMAYTIDTSDVVVDSIGEYTFTVTYKNIRKQGRLSIVDTTPPAIETKELVIQEGTDYDASSFVVKCNDLTGCNYKFEETNTKDKYTTAGSYVVVISAEDAHGNKTIKQESLIIEKVGYVKYFIKENNFDFDTNSQVTEHYELHFTDFASQAIILTGIHTTVTTYSTDDAYQEARKEYYGEINYVVDDDAKTITYTEKANVVGYNYSRYEEVMRYLENQGFEETDN